MPELPEVETIVRELKKNIKGETFKDVWTDSPKMVKKPSSFLQFRKLLFKKKIRDVERRGKYIIFTLSDDYTLLAHQKLTGHFLLGKWKQEKGKWVPTVQGPIKSDPANRFLHFLFFFKSGRMLGFSDLRKFAKFELWKTKELLKSNQLLKLGIDPTSESFTFSAFKGALHKRQKGKIKTVLMDQSIIAGIGNIYSNEILWEAKISPFRDINTLSDKELKAIYTATKKILFQALKVKGESFSDYRDIYGKKGGFNPYIKVYKRNGKPCFRCGTIIKASKIGGRTAYYCPHCQK